MEENNKVVAWIGTIITLIYLVSPLDIVPDVVPFAGQLDDIFIAITGFSNLAQKYLADYSSTLAHILGFVKWICIIVGVLVILVGVLIALLVYKAFS
ncbi:MAG: DUF1232 domain-containing protein [Paludibacteraceae bacterium]|nr:DUF1232 domain-containing protein [Paludibacteraceae bacterium]